MDSLPIPEATNGRVNRTEYFDSDLPGFGIRLSSSGNKTYFVKKRVNGKETRVKLGRHGVITPTEARKQALEAIVSLDKGIDINREKKSARKKKASLGEALNAYFDTHPQLKPGTLKSYKSVFNNHLKDWMDKALQDITREMVQKRHLKINQTSGPAQANKTMRTLRLVFNFGMNNFDLPLLDNPVSIIVDQRLWFKVERRKTVIKETQLKEWFFAVKKIDNQVIRDYFELLLYTGVRKNEALKILWDDVDMDMKTFTIIAENAKTREITLPMSTQVFNIFQRRLRKRENKYVFPSDRSKSGHLVDPRKQIENIKIQTGINFCNHDLRRGFATIAQDVVTYSELKALMNHSGDADVTQGYLSLSLETLRRAAQKVADVIDLRVYPREKGQVIPLVNLQIQSS